MVSSTNKKNLITGRVFTAVLLICAFMLTGCTSGTHSSGKISIRYHSAALLERNPVFTEDAGVIHMSFNGYEWYTVQVISKAERDELTENREVLAESSNIKIYDTSDDTADFYQYTYIFELSEDIDYCIRFDTDDGPAENTTYGKDFTRNIQYYVDGNEVIPEVPGNN